MLPGQNLIGIQAISGAPLTMTRAVASPPGDPQLAWITKSVFVGLQNVNLEFL